jgi:hypothetical protein
MTIPMIIHLSLNRAINKIICLKKMDVECEIDIKIPTCDIDNISTLRLIRSDEFLSFSEKFKTRSTRD